MEAKSICWLKTKLKGQLDWFNKVQTKIKIFKEGEILKNKSLINAVLV